MEGSTIKLTCGDSASFDVKIYNSVSGTEYQLQNGDAIYFSIKKNVNDSPELLKKQAVNNRITLEPSDTHDLASGVYKYDVQLNKASGEVYTVIGTSNFELMPGVTE